jgi:phosphate transport system substrate-binding protein
LEDLSMNRLLIPGAMAALALTFACDSKPADGSAGDGPKTIRIDGSSTVFPITEAVAEEYQKGKKVRVTIGVSGTGGGFKKFCRKETDISGASRPIKPSEVELCKQAGVEYIELPVAYDGLAVVVNQSNDWVAHITPAELKTMWSPEAQGKITKWSQVREGWPDTDLKLYGPGIDSGTYDYFTKAINGKEHSSRGDFTSSEDDNVLVHGVSTDKGGLGFFGLAYYAENKDKLKLVPVDDGKADNGDGPIAPSIETVKNGTYQPLSRPVFIYVRKEAADRPEIKALIDFYLGVEGRKLIEEVGYIGLGEKAYGLVKARYDSKTTGSLFEGKGSTVGATVEQLLSGGAG